MSGFAWDAQMRAEKAEAERDRLRTAIENAPHAEQCATNGLHTSEDDCDCWKCYALEGQL